MVPREVGLFRGCVCLRLFCRCFTGSGDEMEVFYVKKIPNGCKKVSKTINTDLKGDQNEPRNLQKRTLRNRFGKIRKNRGSSIYLWEPFLIKIDKIPIQKHAKNNRKTNMEFDANGCPNRYTHQKSMPKLVSKKIIQIINNHGFPMCKLFEGVAGCVRER